MKRSILRFLRSQRGVTSLEYALLASLISVIIVGAVTSAGETIGTLYGYIRDQIIAAKS